MRLAIAAQGWFDPAAPFTSIDLGCGYGLSTLFHAAAYPHANFVGIDALGSHVSWATGMATAADLENATFHHALFADAGDFLPAADLITAHGVWSWVGEEIRRQALALVVSRLKPGGLFYVSYNALPGMAEMLPIREHLLAVFRKSQGSLEDRIAAAFNAAIASAAETPRMAERLKRLATGPTPYLAHEFFNEHWRCFTAAEVAASFGGANLRYLGPAGLKINDADDFRADLFVRTDSSPHLSQDLSDVAFAVNLDRESFVRVPTTTPTAHRLLHRLARAPASASVISTEALFASVPKAAIDSALTELLSLHAIDPVLPPVNHAERRERTDRLNRALWAQALVSGDVTASVSPVTGSGVHVTRVEQLFLQALVRQGDPVVTATDVLGTEHRDAISQRFTDFEARRLPLLKDHGVI